MIRNFLKNVKIKFGNLEPYSKKLHLEFSLFGIKKTTMKP